MSAQPCGCDPEANWTCDGCKKKQANEAHRAELAAEGPIVVRGADRRHNRISTLPTDPKARKTFPLATGLLDYFPDALAAVAHVSYIGNQQHNPGQPLHWAREKSTDQDDTLIRHFMERGGLDTDGARHSAKMVWRALAILQLEIEEDQKKQEAA